MKKKHLITIFSIVIGGLAGWLYWRYVGCLGNSCPILSNPWLSTGYGVLIGYLVGGLVKPKVKTENTSETEVNSSSTSA